MKRTNVVATVVAVFLILGIHAFAQTPGSTSSSTAVERLAERLLGYWGDPAVSHAEIFPEGLPANLPFELPLPDSAMLVGSVAHYERGDLVTVQVVVDTPQVPEDALDAFLEGFRNRGWVAGAIPPAVGFLPVQTSASGQACDPATGIFAFMHATSRPAGARGVVPATGPTTDLRLDVNLAAVMYNPPCDAAALVPHPYADQAPLPALHAPAGSELVPHGTIQMPDQASSTAVLSIESSATLVAAHYAARLASAGWSLDATYAEAQHVVTTWSFTDPQGSKWHGSLSTVVLDGAGQVKGSARRYALSIFVTQVPDGSPEGG